MHLQFYFCIEPFYRTSIYTIYCNIREYYLLSHFLFDAVEIALPPFLLATDAVSCQKDSASWAGAGNVAIFRNA